MEKKIKHPRLTLVLPVYNEEKRIGKSLEKFLVYLENSMEDYEIIIVDDGSRDATLKIIDQYKNSHFKILVNEKNRGKGYSVKQGMLAAKFSVVLFSDADSSTPITELDNFFPLLGEYDIIIGSRALKESQITVHQPFYKEWLGRVGNKLIQIFLLPGIKDTQCGFKLFKKNATVVFHKQTIERWGFDFEILYLAKKMGYKIKEQQVHWQNDFSSKVKGSDYLGTGQELVKIIWNILTNKYAQKL